MAREGKPPAFQLYARDDLAALHGCSLEEWGAVQKLRAVQWEHGPRSAAPADLARDLGCTRARAERLLPALRRVFVDFPGQKLADPALEQQRASMVAFSRQQAAKGAASAAAKAAAKAAEQAESPATAVDPGLPVGGAPGAPPAATEPPTAGQPGVNSALRTLQPAGQNLPHPLAGARAPQPPDPWLQVWERETGALMPDATGLAQLGDDLQRIAARLGVPDWLDYATEACRAFATLRAAWQRAGVTCPPTPWKMRLHLGLVQEVVRGDLDPDEAARSSNPDTGPGGRSGGGRVPIARAR